MTKAEAIDYIRNGGQYDYSAFVEGAITIDYCGRLYMFTKSIIEEAKQ